jgi:hypothetical protein
MPMLRCPPLIGTGLVLLAVLVRASPAAADGVPIGTSCASGTFAATTSSSGNNLWCNGSTYQYPAYQFGNSSATCDSTNAGITKYTGNHLYFCNGTAWTQVYEVQSTPAITAPTGSGYFVLTATTYDGVLGGRSGADTKCLTELGTTSTGWQGYSDASSRSLITGTKVHAFLCDGTVCNNLMPLTTYYFANAGNGAAGGASLTTDSSGLGPGDNNNWSAANYFSGTYSYWTNRGGTSTAWADAIGASTRSCTNWTVTTGFGWVGQSSSTTATRFDTTVDTACSTKANLICYVNP